METDQQPPAPSGLPAALMAYTIWGLLPLYLLLVQAVPPFELVGWRAISTLLFAIIIVLLRRQWPELRRTLRNRRAMLVLATTATLIGGNWGIYIWAIQQGHVYAASLGYYINPLMNVLLGTLILKERLSRPQWLAVALAIIGVGVLAWGAFATLWISLGLSLTFACYGLLRKQVPIGAVPGLTLESILLLPPSLLLVWWYAMGPAGSSIAVSPALTLSILLGGAVTAIPLLLFAIAARRMSYSALGFIQFLAPSIVFVLGLTVFDKPLQTVQIISFALIWAAVGLFVWDQLNRLRQPNVAPAKPAPPAD